MKISSQLLLTFLLNAVWQIALITVLAGLGSWLLRHSAMRFQHWLWAGALCLSLLIPVATASRALPDNPSAPVSANFRRELTDPLPGPETLPLLPLTAASASSLSFQLNRSLALGLLLAYCAFLLYRGFKLAQAWQTTRIIRRSAVALEPGEDLAEIIRRCEMLLGIGAGRVSVCRSASLPVPVTIGLFRPAIILPDSLLHEGNNDLLTSAIGHEFIHVARHDYILNFIYELFFLPVSFHPAAAFLRRRIKQTRELCCDELVAERILNAETYARSLVALASSAPPLRRLSITTTVGIADADILEARIMSLLSRPKLNRRWKKLLLLAVSLLLLIPSFAAAALALRFEVETNAQEPSQQERELKEKQRADGIVREERNEQEFRERMARDPEFRREIARKMQLEQEMRQVKQAALLRLAKIPMDQAILIATSQQPGKVLACTLEAERWEEPGKLAKDGYVFYQVVIADETNAGATFVWVNAVDGTIIKNEKELPRKLRSPENR